MTSLPDHPTIFEINTAAWLNDLGTTLGTVPPAVWDGVAAPGVDAVWLMGIWERSPAGTAVAQTEPWLLDYGRQHLDKFTLDDIIGSAYCVRDYTPDPRFGGWDGLDAARRELRDRNVGLILDFVPNHVAPDHPWVDDHPEFFVSGAEDDLTAQPGQYVRAGQDGRVFALARDPYFAPWRDVLQLNAFHPGLRAAAAETLDTISRHCDGVRCDMAMLMMDDVFASTWGARAGAPPDDEYWPAVIGAVPDLTFIAEAYWDREWALMEQGFDYCYDKRLYDRLVHGTPESVRLHLLAGDSYQQRLVRFVENHDEPRAAATFSPLAHRAAAVVSSTLPGAVLFHQGQTEGRRLHVPVALRRRPAEEVDLEAEDLYGRLIPAGQEMRRGSWRLLDAAGWPDNDTCRNVVTWCWTASDSFHLVVVNLAATPAQALIKLPVDTGLGDTVSFTDALTGNRYERRRDEPLYVGLHGYGCHVLRTSRSSGVPPRG